MAVQAITSDHIGQIVSFSVYPEGYLGNNFQKVKVLAILDADTALTFEDIASQHANVYVSLPQGYNQPGKHRTYQYLRIQLQSGERQIIGIPWINLSTFDIVQAFKTVITVNDVLPNQVGRLRNALLANGFTNFQIEEVPLT